MQTVIGTSSNRDPVAAVKEATANITTPKLLIVISAYEMLKPASELISKQFHGVPCIGSSSISYYESESSDQRLIIIAFGSDAAVQTGVIRYLSSCPIYDIKPLEDGIRKIAPGQDNSVCIEFCTNDEERLVTTMNVALEAANIPLVGGTVYGYPAGATAYVMVDGVLYPDACCYALIRNTTGKIRTYSENIYGAACDAKRHIATKVDLKNKELLCLDGRPAADVYCDELGLSRDRIVDNVLKNPLGRVVGDEVFISSMYKLSSNGSLTLYKRINENDTISILSLLDYKEINHKTLSRIKSENSHCSFVFSVNCIYRHLLFTNENYLGTFLKDMRTIAPHVGVVGGGEQYRKQHVNQTMVCAVFE